MKSFWSTYLLTAAFGSMAIHYGAPKLRPLIAPRQDAPAPSYTEPVQSGVPDIGLAAPVVEAVLEPELAPRSRGTPAAPLIGSLPAAVPPSPGTPEARPDTPGVRTGKWGVTTTQTGSYEPNGTRIGRLAGGTVVEVQGSVGSSRGSMTICRYRQNGSWQGPVLIGESDLAFFSGSVADFPAESLDALQRYFEAKGLVDARTAELTRQQVEANPHTASYRQAYEKLTALQERAKTLTAERDNATGEARTRAIEELRLMKDEQARLRTAFDQAQSQYRTWKSEHAATSSVDPSTDPQIQAWERRMSTLKSDVRKVLPDS